MAVGEIDFAEFAQGILGSAGSDEQTSLTKKGLGHDHESRMQAIREREAARNAAMATSLEDAVRLVREAIQATIPGGGGEMLRAFKAFRQVFEAVDAICSRFFCHLSVPAPKDFFLSQPHTKNHEQILIALHSFKSGSADNLVNFSEFERGMNYLGVSLPRELLEKFFSYVDKSGDGEIDFGEFAQGILGSAGSDEQTSLTKKGLGHDHESRMQAIREREAARNAVGSQLNSVEEAAAAVRKHVAASTASGPGEMLRMFKNFRSRTGSEDNLVSFPELKHGLQRMGIDLPESIARQLFDHLDPDGNGEISMTEFAEGIMGVKLGDAQTSLTKSGLAGGREHAKRIERASKRHGRIQRAAVP
eukprot:SAG31_NODE_314_length_17854_cov_3.932075_16_plen_361_part_00